MQAGVPEGSVLSPILYSRYVPQEPGVFHPSLQTTPVCRRQIVRRVFFSESYSAVSAQWTWCERWNIKINEEKTQAIYFSHRRGPPEFHLTLIAWNIPFVIAENTSVQTSKAELHGD
jgi:hypothetical protein